VIAGWRINPNSSPAGRQLFCREDSAAELASILFAVLSSRCLSHSPATACDFDGIVGASAELARVLDVVRKVARSQSTVLVYGETGTGKELIAGAVHRNSTRASRAFVKVNCAALQQDLLESELFGHEKGAFTGADRQRLGRFEQADGGTLLLDEIGDMSLHTQAKILRVLQEQEFERLGGMRTLRVDVRFIAATHADLPAMVQAGRFREDLYYRLNVVPIEMPTLRQRRDDILPLAGSFVRRFASGLHKLVDGFDQDAELLLLRHDWPGNVRELENMIERAVLLVDGRTIGAADLRMAGRVASGSSLAADLVRIPPAGIPLEVIERHALLEALKMSNWVPRAAADLLSITPRVLHYKIKAFGIDKPPGVPRRHA
jgi:transcriptional regulator with GAF, ATPase, and Fis domain